MLLTDNLKARDASASKNHLDNDLDANVAMVMMNLVNFKMRTFHNLEYDDDDD